MNNQISIFDELYPKYKITKKVKLIELFGGYGSQNFSLKYLNVDYEHHKLCEWTVKSIQAYKDAHCGEDTTNYSKDLTPEEIKEYLFNKGISANYNEPMTKEQINRLSEKQVRTIYNNIIATHNLVNIQQVKGEDLEISDTDKYDYILCYSFPCQDLSLAGKRALMSDTTTRSGMLWEVERILSECKELGTLPQILLMENVIQVHGEGAVKDFNKWQLRLEELGYKNYWQDLIATDYGIPQIRNRCFMISILGNYSYTFPKSSPLKLKLKDLLEDNVGGKYFLSDKCIKTMLKHNIDYKPTGLSPTLTTELSHHTGKNFTPKIIREIDYAINNSSTIDDKYYLSDKMKNYIMSENNKYKVDKNKLVINRELACSKTTREGQSRADTSDYISKELPENCDLKKVITTENFIQWKQKGRLDIDCRAYYEDKVAPTTTTTPKSKVLLNNLKIRKLTPKECFRLMGVKDEDYEKIKKNQSDSSLYHLAGDSIVVNVLMAIFNQFY